jgi:CheY-like chemotaxis protein
MPPASPESHTEVGHRIVAESHRITVVNDSGPFLELMSELLTEEGHVVTTFDGRQTDVAELAASRPDLLIVDLRLISAPAMYRGWELIEESRLHPELRTTPVLVCTGAVEGIRERLGAIADTPALEVVLKPFDIEELLGAIDRLLSLPPTEREWPPTATIVHDLDTRIMDVSADAAEYLEFPKGELVGRSATELVAWPAEQTQEELRRALAEGGWNGIVPIRDRRGEERRLRVNVRRQRIGVDDVLVTRILMT